jgi:hypothetical protein
MRSSYLSGTGAALALNASTKRSSQLSFFLQRVSTIVRCVKKEIVKCVSKWVLKYAQLARQLKIQ